jgi:hypothetical protein
VIFKKVADTGTLHETTNKKTEKQDRTERREGRQAAKEKNMKQRQHGSD